MIVLLYLFYFFCSLRRAIQPSCWWTAWKPWWLRTVSRVMTLTFWIHIPVPLGFPPIWTYPAPCRALVSAACTRQQIRTQQTKTEASPTVTACAMAPPTTCPARTELEASRGRTARRRWWRRLRIDVSLREWNTHYTINNKFVLSLLYTYNTGGKLSMIWHIISLYLLIWTKIYLHLPLWRISYATV